MSQHERTRLRAQQLAEFLDDAITVPGTGWRFGWDGIIGLIPGVGDLVTTLMGLYLVHLAMAAGAPSSVLARMTAYIAFDSLVGAVPFIGDFFDFAIKSNRRNAKLLQKFLENPGQARRRSRGWVAAVVSVLAMVLLLCVYGVYQLFAWLVSQRGWF